MNYKLMHDNLIKLCQETNHRDRLAKRNSNDIRLLDEIIYTEKHHIIPKHDNGKDNKENLVIVLPEEHYLLHLLRYKYLHSRNDFLAVRCMRNGYIYKKQIKCGSFLNKLGVHKHMIASFRKKIGWHTSEGIKSISNARKGNTPVVDAITGESIGSVDINHPNILSGKWVHHTKGKSTYYDNNGNKFFICIKEAKEKNLISNAKYNNQFKGSKNPMFKEMTEERLERIFKLIPLAIEDNYFCRKVFLEMTIMEFTEFKKLSYVWFINNFKSWDNLIDIYNEKHGTNYKYNAYYRFKSHRLKLAEANRKKIK